MLVLTSYTCTNDSTLLGSTLFYSPKLFLFGIIIYIILEDKIFQGGPNILETYGQGSKYYGGPNILVTDPMLSGT